MLRRASAFVFVALGAVASQIAADALRLDGLAAYLVFLGFVAVFCPVALLIYPGLHGAEQRRASRH